MGKKEILLGAAIVALVAGGMVLFLRFGPDERPRPLETASLLATLADDATESLHDSRARVRAPLFGAEQIGTLINPDGAVGVSRGCRIAVEPVTLHPPGFPPQTYHLTQNAAAKWTQGFLGGLSAKLNLGSSRTVDLSFDDVLAKMLYDDDIIAMAGSPECRQVIGDRKLWIVRGYIQARRHFTIEGGFTDQGGIGLGSTNDFQVDANSGSSTVEVTDREPIALFEIISAVDPGSSTPLAAPHASNAVLIGQATVGGQPRLVAVSPVKKLEGQVFFQRDRNDRSGIDAELVKSVSAAGIPVERTVEAVSTAPGRANVRYFNDEDSAKAEKVLEVIRTRYPDATLSRFPLSAPRGQMEVWLPAEKPGTQPN